MIRHVFAPQVYAAVLPRPRVRTVDWAAAHVSMPAGSEMKGRFRVDLFPHIAEVLDCCDDPHYERVTFQGASRLGKTVAAQVFLAKTAARNPHPMAIADADEMSTKRVIKRTWKLFASVEDLAAKLPPERLRSSERMELVDCLIHGCWSGSPATAADFAALVVVLNEVDKMSRRKSSEADFALLMAERCKGFPHSTLIEISTPGLTGASRVEAARLEGDNRQRYVPCPHCGHYQTLRTGDGQAPGGLRWQKGADGKSDPDVARETAWYECESCRGRILDEHRYAMLGAGVWLKEGQSIDKRGRVSGTPTRQGRHASFGPIGTHYSLLNVTWGDIAAKFLRAVRSKDREQLRHYFNSWEGVTWDPQPVKVEPAEVAERLGVAEPPRRCPAWSRFLTLSVDVGSVGEDLIFYWWAAAWGVKERGQLVDYGVTEGEAAFLALVRGAAYPHADGGPPLRPVRIGIDCGDGKMANRVYQLCDQLAPLAWPLKGSNTSRFPEVYTLGFRRTDVPPKVLARKRKLGLGDLLIVNSERSQAWAEDLVTGRTKRDASEWFSAPAELFELDPDLAVQLLGDYPDEERDEAGRKRTVWRRRGPNEWRDTARYGWALAWHYTQQGRLWPSVRRAGSGAESGDRRAESRKAERSDQGGGFVRRPTSRRTFRRRGGADG